MTRMESVVRYDAVDAAWLTEALTRAGALSAGRVASVERERCGTGILADAYRYTLTYDPPGAGPPTVVGKFASENATSRAFGHSSGQYRNEIRFYQNLATALPASVPTPLHAALADNETDFVLLMEDLAPARAVDQIEGCTADEAAIVMEQIAALHAGSWRRRDLAASEWLGNTIAGWRQITDGFDGTIASFPEGFVSEADLGEASKLVPHRDAWKDILSEPRSLWHNDLRVDNVLFDCRGGAVPIALLDWQGVTYARGMMDVAYFNATSLTTEERRAHERDLVVEYHAGLVAQGVTELSADACWDEYRLLAIHPLQTGVLGLMAVSRSERGDRLWRTWIERSAEMTRDLDSFSLLAAR